jgi:hypothetical protein
MSSRLAASLLGLILIGLPAVAASQVQTSSDERFFRIEWQMERAGALPPTIVGTVRNRYADPVQRLEIQVQTVDEAGQITHETRAMVGDVPPGGQRAFRLPLPAAGARYVITVHSFEFGAGQSP